ncbi:MAG: M48 family peptidase, partial [Alphaproteobacteria bacterium]
MTDQVTIGGVLLHLETSARAKRIQIRVDGRTGKAKLIIPLRESRQKAIDFARSREDWLQKQSD